MSNFILDDKVVFTPDECKLSPLASRGPVIVLNTPVSRLLLTLLENDGAVVPHQEIMRVVWESHGQFVTLNTLYQNVSLLRKNLKRSGLTNFFIRTHPKTGFSLRGKVSRIESDNGYHSDKIKMDRHIQIPKSKDIDLHPPSEQEPAMRANNKISGMIINASHFLPAMKIKILMVLFFTFTIGGVVIFNTYHAARRDFNEEHRVIARVNQCSLYVDRTKTVPDITPLVSYLKESNISCKNGEFLYLIKGINRDEILLFTCTPDPNDDDDGLNCVTTKKIPPYLYPSK